MAQMASEKFLEKTNRFDDESPFSGEKECDFGGVAELHLFADTPMLQNILNPAMRPLLLRQSVLVFLRQESRCHRVLAREDLSDIRLRVRTAV